tara:strand:- start:131 stop:664 length:534 start_codon:yes stop_codon:yes gene_type:complete
MQYIPYEIIDYIIDFILPKKCYLEDSNPNLIKKFALLSKRNYQKFKCKPTFIHIIDNKYLEFCKIHDQVLLENLRRLLKMIKYNFNNENKYFVKLIIDNIEQDVALTDFNMEPHVSLTHMDFIYHSIPFPELEGIEITKINEIMKQIFKYLKLDYNTQHYGVNSVKLKKFFNNYNPI